MPIKSLRPPMTGKSQSELSAAKQPSDKAKSMEEIMQTLKAHMPDLARRCKIKFMDLEETESFAS
jgi:hypothetical protein